MSGVLFFYILNQYLKCFDCKSNLLLIITISSMSVNPCCLSISAPYAKWRYFVSGKKQKREAKKGTGMGLQRIFSVLQGRTVDLRAGLKFPSPGGEGLEPDR